MAKLAPNSYDLPEPNYEGGNFRDAFKAQEEAFKKLQEASDAIDFNDPKASLKGALLRWQRADGYAHYIVTADRPLTVQHVPFLDAWTVESALIRGLTRADVIAQLKREKAMKELFSKKKD